MNLPDQLYNRWSQSDLFLFTAGGCHIFCRALLRLMPGEGYEARHLHLKGGDTHTDSPGYHIYAFHAGYAVDALGIRREDDLIAWTAAKENCSVTAHAFQIDTAFDKVAGDFRTGPTNLWGLPLHDLFVQYIDSKAHLLILQEEARYSVKLLLKGFTK